MFKTLSSSELFKHYECHKCASRFSLKFNKFEYGYKRRKRVIINLPFDKSVEAMVNTVVKEIALKFA